MINSSLKTSIPGVFIIDLVRYEDSRGWLMELFRSDHLHSSSIPAMGYVSQTEPGVMRGPHEHKEQSDLFCFLGPGKFELFLCSSDRSLEERFLVGEDHPVAVIVPPGVIHGYTNKSEYPGLVLNFPNRLFGGPGRCYPIDEMRHEETGSFAF